MTKPLACLLLAAALSACASPRTTPRDAPAPRSGGVGVQDISGLLQAPTGRIALAPNEAYLEPLEAVGSPMPAYPADLLSARLEPQSVCISVAIGTRGEILARRELVEPPTCPAAAHAAFAEAALGAVSTWTFEPARRCVFPSAAAKELAHASCSGGEAIPIAVTLTYRFVYAQRDGRGDVRLGR